MLHSLGIKNESILQDKSDCYKPVIFITQNTDKNIFKSSYEIASFFRNKSWETEKLVQ